MFIWRCCFKLRSNGKILDSAGFKNIWIQPSSGDAGSSLGAALLYLHKEKSKKNH